MTGVMSRRLAVLLWVAYGLACIGLIVAVNWGRLHREPVDAITAPDPAVRR